MTIALRLFALSFVALFLELMMIRWVPSMASMTQYYGNLLLISSFLGLGIGSRLSGRGMGLFRWFPLVLSADTALLLLCHHMPMPGTLGEARFAVGPPRLAAYAALIAVAICNTSLFVPLGEQVGGAFDALPRLRAYSWDLAGSLFGTLTFGLFSFRFFSPTTGMLVALVIVAALTERRLWATSLPLFGLVLVAISVTTREGVLWSPYHYITIAEADYANEPPRTTRALPPAPGAGLRSMTNPPMYAVRVNQHFYQLHGTIDPRRYTPGNKRLGDVAFLREQYLMPYSLKPGPKQVAVMGSGGGMDCEAALLAGAEHVDAVEIDPALIRLARRYNASGVYDDPRVNVHITDARSFLQNTTRSYDVIAYGFLDSQGLFSVMSNLRLDGFTYTVEGLRAAYGHLRPDGLLVVSFVRSHEWLVRKLRSMMAEASGRQPLVYAGGGQVVIGVSPSEIPAPESVGRFARVELPLADVPSATDEWPYLYLARRAIPLDYALVIGTLMLLSVGVLLVLRTGDVGRLDLNMLFLGFSFLLLETKSISDCSLYFGATWFVTTLVVAGCLGMILAANLLAERLDLARLNDSPVVLYGPLFAALALPHMLPRDGILSWSMSARVLWVLVAIPLPFFFAGLVFSTRFQAGGGASTLLGANLIGATLGGFSEYLGMAIGSRALSLLVIGGYTASLLCHLLGRRQASWRGAS